jgi:cysteine-rich repeat protein
MRSRIPGVLAAACLAACGTDAIPNDAIDASAPTEETKEAGVCGDGVVTRAERCDDGNTKSGDGCSNECQVEGNGWVCRGAPSVCTVCGDNHIDQGEECDDGNSVSGDGCSSSCVQECPEGSYDLKANLCWENPVTTNSIAWQGAVDYCKNLATGNKHWRLPSIDELRSLIQGCPATAPGGACGIDNSGTIDDITHDCDGCTDNAGGGAGHCYWPTALDASCGDNFWSATVPPDNTKYAFIVRFSDAMVGIGDKVTVLDFARCVRSGP